jgi:hypothetical protein
MWLTIHLNPGTFMAVNLNWIVNAFLQQESGCRAIGCNMDGRSLSCGYFQIKEAYWKDCGSPGKSKKK